MWDIEQHIQKEEKIKYQGTPEWVGYLGVFILALLTIWTVIIPLILVPIAIFSKLSTKYIITNKRVAGRYGIISEDFKSATFKHITSVRTKQGLIGKIFNFGNIIIDTAGTGMGVDFVWKYVKDPVKIKNRIEEYID